eukprot:TRINITY_DN35541_c0_g1_i2.p1 TRINITY_DN35541_c0_g1~~TRINITY_DN35541_c0_g1_i2.p1  ORF type:complete len:310 (+),score=60.44 TRINITY_DN35541_c0_g1_i2:61-990(+)
MAKSGAPSEREKKKRIVKDDTADSESPVNEEMTKHSKALEEICRRLQSGVDQGDRTALSWAQVLDSALDFKIIWTEREAKLRALYLGLYDLAASAKLPAVPQSLRVSKPQTLGAETRIKANVDTLRITLAEALAQVGTQRHPGAFFLLTCHLGKARPPACQNFPWLMLGALLLLIGLLCGPSDRRYEGSTVTAALPRSAASGAAASIHEPSRGAASTAKLAPVALGAATLVITAHLAPSRDWPLLSALGLAFGLFCRCEGTAMTCPRITALAACRAPRLATLGVCSAHVLSGSCLPKLRTPGSNLTEPY